MAPFLNESRLKYKKSLSLYTQDQVQALTYIFDKYLQISASKGKFCQQRFVIATYTINNNNKQSSKQLQQTEKTNIWLKKILLEIFKH